MPIPRPFRLHLLARPARRLALAGAGGAGCVSLGVRHGTPVGAPRGVSSCATLSAALAATFSAACSAPAWAGTAQASAAAAAPAWWLAAAFAGALSGAALGAWWALRRASRVHPGRAAAPLAPEGDWCWQADRDGRLTQLVPPSGQPLALHAWAKSQLTSGPAGQGVAWWQALGAEEGETLHLRLQADGRLRATGQTQVPGQAAPCHWAIELLWSPASGTVQGRARDISAERQAQHREALLQNGLALSDDPVMVLNAPWAPGQAVTWRVAHLNPAAMARWPLADAPALGDDAQQALLRQQELPVQAVLEVLAAPLAEHTLRLEQDEPWRVDLRRMRQGQEAVAILLYRRAQPAAAAQADPRLAEDALRDLESFSYTISHDLRAPIRVVEGFARIVKEDYGAQMDRVGQDHLDRILGASARMTSMIDAILSLSKLSSRPLLRQPVALSQLAGYVVDELRRQQPERVARVTIAPSLVVQGDPTLLRMLLDNLLGNAWKYSGLKPEVVIEVGLREEDGRRVYFVRDEGAGFDMRFADRLFGVFQRLHSSSDFEGTGIGLATVQRIVRRHGGQIWAEGRVGEGATFHFTLEEDRPGGA